ncbi:hypothetical protein CPU12_09185 [Malaciobacter molluscorum LMG 25693]|uniref:Membrane protein n=1 Tax=Malaciobacter molluscorum LMG 25693 TaxID=870501 RepID=A0A2G1DHE1_9BACT|nr:hypothetical protein [Malaciobacter molluscorum]AXX92261.1 putative membrane protein [Malaciobacter molluscorum LMG 25693]PHO17756.1 hypothetical protein CPU12_09185 [Malaciobacter molluscorum LMG 25693]
MAELKVTQRYNPKRRRVKLCVDLPKFEMYKVRFEKEDKTNKKRVGIKCNNEYYTPNYNFKAKEPYVLEIDSGFIGNIYIENQENTLSFPILQRGEEEITLALVQPKENINKNNKDLNKKKNSFTKEDNLTFFQTTNEYFKNLRNEVYSITDEMKEQFIILFKENRNVIYGVVGDVSQEFSSLKDGVWKDIKELKFYIKEIKGKSYVILKGFAGLRQTLKGTKYLLSNPQVGAFAVTTKDIVTWSSILNGTKITILISSAFSLIDYFTTKDGKADFTDIAVNLLTGIGKALISYWVGTAVGLLAMPLVTAGFIGAFGIFIIGAAISIGVGISLNLSDEKYGWTKSLQEKINELQESFNKKIEQIEEDVDNAIYKFFRDLEREFWNWVSANGGTTPYDYGIRY